MFDNEVAAGAVFAAPLECLDDPRLPEVEFVALQPLDRDWGPSVGTVPDEAVQGSLVGIQDITGWNERGSMQVWRSEDTGEFFVLANYHHGVDDCYRVLWLEKLASEQTREEAADFWVMVWLFDASSHQGEDIVMPGLEGVDLEAAFDRATGNMSKMVESRPNKA